MLPMCTIQSRLSGPALSQLEAIIKQQFAEISEAQNNPSQQFLLSVTKHWLSKPFITTLGFNYHKLALHLGKMVR